MESLYTRFVTKTELDYKELVERMKGLCQVISGEQALPAPRPVPRAPAQELPRLPRGPHLGLLDRPRDDAQAAPLQAHRAGRRRRPPRDRHGARSRPSSTWRAAPCRRRRRSPSRPIPVLGYNLLKERQVPLAVCLAALEHHERMNGSGYPAGPHRREDLALLQDHHGRLLLRRGDRRGPSRRPRTAIPAWSTSSRTRASSTTTSSSGPSSTASRSSHRHPCHARQRQERRRRRREPGQSPLSRRAAPRSPQPRRQGPRDPHERDRRARAQAPDREEIEAGAKT